jgi:hypothetical protein
LQLRNKRLLIEFGLQRNKICLNSILKDSDDSEYLPALQNCLLCLSSDNVTNITFWKLDVFPSSGEGVGGAYSVGLVRKS